MDSDEDEEFGFEENIGQRPDRHGGKLSEILSEVETKIPCLEFDDDDNEDLYVWTPPDNVPVFYKQFTSTLCEETASLEKHNYGEQITGTTVVSSMSCQTDPLVSQYDFLTSTTLEDKTDNLDESNTTQVSPPSLISCGTNTDPQVYEEDLSTATLQNKTTTVSAFDKNPIITFQSSSSMYPSCKTDEHSSISTQSSASQTDNDISTYEHHCSTKSSEKVANLDASFDEQLSGRVSLPSSVSCQTEKSYSRNTRMDAAHVQMLDSRIGNIETEEALINSREQVEKTSHSIAKNDAEYGDQLDFNVLNEINFNILQSVLGTISSEHTLSVSDFLPDSSQEDREPQHTSDADLMVKLFDLSKDQLSSCNSVRDIPDFMDESVYQKKRKVKGNRGSTKAIHTWSQLSSDETFVLKEPQTIFLDLRPLATLEKEKQEKDHSESIQRILGLNKARSDSFSDDESDDELAEWREMRTKLKERAKKEPENNMKSTHTHVSKLTKNPISLQKTETAPPSLQSQITTMERLYEEELTGGLPLDTCGRNENIVCSKKELDFSTGKFQIQEGTANVSQNIEEKSSCLNYNAFTQVNTATVKANSGTSSKVDRLFKSDGCVSKKKYNEQLSISRTVTKDESFVHVALNHEKLEAEDDHDGNMAYKGNTCSEGLTTSRSSYDPTDAGENIFHKENGEYISSSDNLKNENHGGKENMMVVNNHVKENSIDIQHSGDEKGLNSYSNTFNSSNKTNEQLDERISTCNAKSEEKQLNLQETGPNVVYMGQMAISFNESVGQENRVGSLSTADIRMCLRLSETKEDSDVLLVDSTEKSRHTTNVTLPRKQSEQKTDTRTLPTANHEQKEEKSIIANGQGISHKEELSNDFLDIDLRNVYKNIEHITKEKTKQSRISRTPTPNSGENKLTPKNKVDTRPESPCDVSKAQKQRSQKEMKKLKEKLRMNIENMRPTVTASGKYPVTYNTPIIYDQDASFEPHQQGLLSTTEDQLSLLLIVRLSSCGEISHQYCKGRKSGSEVNYYFALLSWLLHLCVPNNGNSSVPFVVVGMHQAHQNGLLQLFIGVQPNEKIFYPNTAKDFKKNKTRAFNKAIFKYLSTHSLRSVYQNMDKVYLNGSCQVDENSYSSKMLSTCITVGQDSNAVRRVFNSRPGFYWETIEMDGSSDVFQSSSCDIHVENTVVFVRAPLFYHPSCVLDLLTRIENEGCGVAGMRLTKEHDSSAGATCYNGEHEILQSRYYCDSRHFLALAVTGPFAIAKIKKIIGSKIPLLDDPREIPSLRSLYSSTSTEDKLFYCPSYSSQAASQLARVFGGRLTEDDIAAVEDCGGKPKPCSPDSVPAQKPPALLVSSTRVAFYLIISPLVPSSFLGQLLDICFLRGFVLHGVRRVQLSKRQGANLGLSQLQFTVFCPLATTAPSPSESPPGSPARGKTNLSLEATLALTKTSRSSPSTILILQKENGLYHAASLVKHLFESLKERMETNSTGVQDFEDITPRMYLTITQFNDANSKLLWGDVCYKPDISLLRQARNNRFKLNPEVEQVCILSSLNREAIQHVGILLKKLYSDSNHIAGDWELLGIKSFPNLSLVQAREVTPYEVGDHSWQSSLKLLMSATVFVCVLRGIDIIQRLRDFVMSLAKMVTKESGIRECVLEDWWISQTTEVAYRQLTVLFEEQELCSDETNRTNTKFVPPLRQRSIQSSTPKESKTVLQKKRKKWTRGDHKVYSTDDSSTSVETTQFSEIPIIQSLLVGARPLPTVALIKPSCVLNTKKIGKIFKSVLQENFDIVALSMRVLTRSEAQVLVHDDEPAYNDHVQYLTSGASLLICLQRENAVKKLLDILGPEDPIIARSLDPFLLRGCYGVDSIHNAIHGSESYGSAVCELKMLFPCGVCCEQTIDLEAEQIPCRAFDATIGKKTEGKLTKYSNQLTGTVHSLTSSLVQVNCLILTRHVVYGRSDRKRIALVDVLDCLLSTNFVPVGMKMAMLSREQVNGFLVLIGSRAGDRRQNLEVDLTEGPCIILALQRDNAITCFDSIIKSVEGKRRSITEYRKHIIQAETEEEARNLLMYFFDGLVPNSVQQICLV